MDDLKLLRAGALLGVSDERLAEVVLGISLGDLAVLAYKSEAVFNAITPSQAEIDAFNAPVKKARERRNARKRMRIKEDPSYRVENAMRARIWAAMKGRSDGALFSRLSYTQSDLMFHLERQFYGEMTWENYGKWHIDHIKPCSLFDQTNMEEFAECWALNNLQPLWASENTAKGAKYG